MSNKTVRRALTAAACTMALSFGLGSGAQASVLNFTWNPSATGELTIGPFTADTFELGDYATIDVPANPAPKGLGFGDRVSVAHELLQCERGPGRERESAGHIWTV